MNQTRRRYLAAVGTIAVGTGVAGCLGGDGGSEAAADGSEAAETSHSCELTERDSIDELPQPRVGSADADITVAVFEDFACEHCADFSAGPFSQLKADFADDETVAFDHYDFPIPVSDWSERVANAARSIQEDAGDEAFFEFSEAAYANQDDYSWQVIGDLADDVGVDPCRVLSDATYDTYESVIQANFDEGEERGVPGTPAVYVDGELTDSTYDAITEAIESAR